MQTQTKIPSGSLQVQKGRFHMVIHVEREGKMTPVWRTTGLPAEERFRAQAETMLQETRLRLAYDPVFREEFLARKRQKLQTSAPGGKKKSSAPAAKTLRPEQQTVADYLRGWYQSARPNLARATRTSYEQMLNCRILPHFEALGITMAELRPPHIQQLIDRIFAEGCNGTTAQRYYAVLKRALQVAVRQEILPGNPADRVDRPRKNQFHGSVYTAQQVKTLLDESAQDEIFLPVFLSAYYGLRRSEVLGLRWSAVDFEQKTIEINHKLVTCRENGKTITVGGGRTEKQVQPPGASADSPGGAGTPAGPGAAGTVPEKVRAQLVRQMGRIHLSAAGRGDYHTQLPHGALWQAAQKAQSAAHPVP